MANCQFNETGYRASLDASQPYYDKNIVISEFSWVLTIPLWPPMVSTAYALSLVITFVHLILDGFLIGYTCFQILKFVFLFLIQCPGLAPVYVATGQTNALINSS